MPAYRKPFPARSRALLVVLLLIAVAGSLLGGCSSSPRMAQRNRNRLRGLMRTVIYVAPSASSAVGRSVALGNYPFGPRGSDVTGFLLGGLIYTTMRAYYRDRDFARSLSGYGDEIRVMHIPDAEAGAARRAVRGVAWLHGTRFEELTPDGRGDWVHRTVMDASTKAVIFIYPGPYVRDDAKAVGMRYAVVSYVKVRAARILVRKLDSETVKAEIPVQYPPKYAHFNELTAPTTSAAAWRLQYLFSGTGQVFAGSLREAIQEAGWKLNCYFAARCEGAHPDRGFGWD